MRTTYLILIALFLSFSSSAQAELKFGITAALNYSTVSWDDVADIGTKGKTGLSIGIVPEIVLSEKIKIPLNLVYSLKGHEEDFGNGMVNNYSYHYIDFMPEFDARVFGPLRAGMGFKFGYKVQEFRSIPGQSTADKVDFLNPVDAGLTGNVKVLFSNWQLFCRYDFGVTSVNEIFFTDENGNDIGQTDQYNRNVQLGVSVFLN